MKKIFVLLSKVLDLLSGLVFFLLMMVTATDVIGRYLFDSPVTGGNELTEVLLATLVFVSLPHTSRNREHINVTLFEKLFNNTRLIKLLSIDFLSAALLAFFGWRLWLQAETLQHYKDHTMFLDIPHYPIAYFMSVMCFLSALFVLLTAINSWIIRNESRLECSS